MDSSDQSKVKIENSFQQKTAEQAGGLEVSSVEADKLALENTIETESAVLEGGADKQAPQTAPVTTAVLPTETQIKALEKDQVTVEVENILEKGLKDVYGNLPDNLKPVFKAKGEETARTISEMIKKTAVKIGEVMKLIFNWLRIIPGLNRFYLEQEAKIKADQIMVLSEQIAEDKLKK